MENEKFSKRIDLIVETMMARGLGFDFFNKKPKLIHDQKLLKVAPLGTY